MNSMFDFITHVKGKNTLMLACKIAATPFVGLLFVILLPVVLLGTLSYALFSGVVGKWIFFLETGRILPLRSFGWRPTEAYLVGKNKKKDDSDKAGRSPAAK